MARANLSDSQNRFRSYVASLIDYYGDIDQLFEGQFSILSRPLRPSSNGNIGVLLRRQQKNQEKLLEKYSKKFVSIASLSKEFLGDCLAQARIEFRTPNHPIEDTHDAYSVEDAIENSITRSVKKLSFRLERFTQYGSIDYKLAHEHGLSKDFFDIQKSTLKEALVELDKMMKDYPLAFESLLTRANQNKLDDIIGRGAHRSIRRPESPLH